MFFRSTATNAPPASAVAAIALAVGLSAAATQPARAQTSVNLYNSSQAVNTTAGASNGPGRGTLFHVNSVFTSDTASVNADLDDQTSYDFALYSYTGTDEQNGTVGSTPLKQSTFTAASGSTVEWNDAPFNYTFASNTDYILLFRTHTEGTNLPTGSNFPLFAQPYSTTSDDVTNGPNGEVTVKAGRTGRDAESANSDVPQLQLVVPEPTSLAAFLGLGALALMRRR